jgi:hypothetical protein
MARVGLTRKFFSGSFNIRQQLLSNQRSIKSEEPDDKPENKARPEQGT